MEKPGAGLDDHGLIFYLATLESGHPEILPILLARGLATVLVYGRMLLSLEVHDRADEDLLRGVHATFEQALQHTAELPSYASLDHWLLGIARRSFRSVARRRTVPSRSVAMREGRADIATGLGRLPVEARELIILRHRFGITLPQLAAQLGMPERRVFRKLEAARRVFVPGGAHRRSHSQRMQRARLALENGTAQPELADRLGKCPDCPQRLAAWQAGIARLEAGLLERWPVIEPPGNLRADLVHSTKLPPLAVAGSPRRSFPWAELALLAAGGLAIAYLAAQGRTTVRGASLPLFEPTPVAGPAPVLAEGGAFLDLTQQENDLGAFGQPAYAAAPQLSDDGTQLIFFYTGDLRSTGDRNGLPDLYRYDLATGSFEWIQSPERVGSFSMASSSTADASLTIFTANRSSIYGFADFGDCSFGPCSGLVVHDAATGRSEWLFPEQEGRQSELRTSKPYLTADGRFLAFFAPVTFEAFPAGGACAAQGEGWAGALLLDRERGSLEPLPICARTAVGDSPPPIEVSYDGRYVLARGVQASPDEAEGTADAVVEFLLYDRDNGRVVALPRAVRPEGDAFTILEAHFARAANQLAFTTSTALLGELDSNPFVDIYVWDMPDGKLDLVSAAASGEAANGHSGARFASGPVGLERQFAISPEGRFVAFVSQATDIVAGLAGGCGEFFSRPCGNLYLRDRETGAMRLLVQEPLQEAYYSDLTLAEDGAGVAFLEQSFGCFPAGYCSRLWLHDSARGRTFDPLTGEEYTRVRSAGNFGSGQAGVVYPSVVSLLVDTTLSRMTLSPDGSLLAVGTNSGEIVIREAGTGELRFELSYQPLPVFELAFGPDGSQLFAAARDGSLARIDAGSGAVISKTYETPARFQAMALAPSGRLLALAGQDQLWLLDSGDGALALLQFKRFEHGPLRALAFSPDSQLLAVGDGAGEIWLVEVESGKIVQRLAGHAGRVARIVFSPDGLLLASSGEDRIVNLWRLSLQLPTAAEHVFGVLHPEWVSDMAFSPDGRILAGVDFGYRVRFYSTDDITQNPPEAIIAGGALLNLRFNPTGDALYLASASSVVRVGRQQWPDAFRAPAEIP